MLVAKALAWQDQGLTPWPLKLHAAPALTPPVHSSTESRDIQNKNMSPKGILDPSVIIYTTMTYSIKTKYTDFHIYIHGSTQCTI